ncbi:hypothetical protein O181_030342 [Austropuccinia psidii MF-1]|uniref:GAG-pre-integrase domain-containing protein n=1 Tax=Austropuccinia psidii MF-1 TaxID=1389203 RepID=A0A9Q3CVK7_9BASI|nr:hypothetical protein [Austropuccinia psidii MF-1]
MGHWRADCPHTKGFENPNMQSTSQGPLCPVPPGAPDCQSQPLLSSHYQRECVSQVELIKHDAADWVLIDTSASIHLSGSLRFATNLRNFSPFRIFLDYSSSLVTVLQTMMLNIPFKHGYVIIQGITFWAKILGTILSVGQLCRVGVMPLFEDLSLSLLLSKILVTTNFFNDCCWMDVVSGEETNVLATALSSPCLFKINPTSSPSSITLSSHEWYKSLGHACNKVVISFLKQHVPTFDAKIQKTLYCSFCEKSKRTHQPAKDCTDIPKDNPLELLGPFSKDAQGLRYLLTVCNHVSTYRIFYPLNSCSDAPMAILDEIRLLKVHNKITPKALRTDNSC